MEHVYRLLHAALMDTLAITSGELRARLQRRLTDALALLKQTQGAGK